MGNKFQLKRTSVSGRTPNTTNSANTSYIDAGELAINLADGRMFSSNGSVIMEFGAGTPIYDENGALITTSFVSLVHPTAIGSHLIPNANITYDLGTANNRWRDLYLSNNTLHLGELRLSANATSLTITDAANVTSVVGTGGNASTVGGNSALDLRTYSDTVAGTAYTNAVAQATSLAGTAYSNAVSTAAADATTKAATAFSNATSTAAADATTKAATAYSNAVSIAATDASTKAATAYSNAVSAAATDASTKAATAYSNAVSTILAGSTFTGAVTMQANLTANNVRLYGDMQIDGNLTVSGTSVTLNVSSLAVEDNMIYLNNGSQVSNPDLGFAGNYNDGTYKHAGLFRDATDGRWKFFHEYTPEPDASAYIDTANASFALANVQAHTFIGAGNLTSLAVSGTTASGNTTITGFANVTSTLQVAGTVAGGNTTITGFANVSGNISANNFLPTGTSPITTGVSFGVYASGAFLNSPTATYGYLATNGGGVLRWGSTGVDVTGTLTAGNTTITGFANVTSTLQVGTNTSTFGTAMYVVANGDVGIGTATPSSRLHVLGSGDPTVDTVGLRAGLANHTPATSTKQYGIYVEQRGGRYAPQTGVYIDTRVGQQLFGGPYFGLEAYSQSSGQAYQVATGVYGQAENTLANYGCQGIGVKGVGISASGGGTELSIGQGSWGGHFTAYGKGHAIGVYADAYLQASPIAGAVATPLMVATNGTELMRVSSNGNVGVGTTTPGRQLDVLGAGNNFIRILGAAGSTRGGLIVGNNDGGSKEYGSFYFDNSNNNVYLLHQYTGGGLVLGANTTAHAFIAASGNFGVGTTSPQQKFVVSNGGALGTEFEPSSGIIQSYNRSTGAYGTMRLDANVFRVYTGNTTTIAERLTVLETGLVGIGNTSPSYKLDVTGQTRIGRDVSQSAPSSTDILSTAHVMLGGQGGNYLTIGQFGSANGFAQWIQSSYINPTIATYNMILNPLGGNVGIGNSSPSSKLHVQGDAYVSGTITEASSIEIKENVVPIEDALSVVQALQGVIYDRKDGSSKNEPGLIAEDTDKWLSSVVTYDADGNPSGIKYTKIVPYLIESIKQLKSQIDQLSK